MSEPATKTGSKKEIEIPEWENAAELGVCSTGCYRLRRGLTTSSRQVGYSRCHIANLTNGDSDSSKSNLPLPSNTDTFTGDLTYYQPGLGACGITSTDDFIVALSHILFDEAGSSTDAGGNSNENPLCGRILRATRYNEEAGAQRSVDLRVVDRCTGCEVDDLDTSLKAFERLAPSASGRVDVSWAWLQPRCSKTILLLLPPPHPEGADVAILTAVCVPPEDELADVRNSRS
ncbi:hypothetical protein KC354_g21 [Hortaea werneckii]|nr:hypothetical protein KC354_g21 [Hortaea werneckii]